jgi:hypothetical protein
MASAAMPSAHSSTGSQNEPWIFAGCILILTLFYTAFYFSVEGSDQLSANVKVNRLLALKNFVPAQFGKHHPEPVWLLPASGSSGHHIHVHEMLADSGAVILPRKWWRSHPMCLGDRCDIVDISLQVSSILLHPFHPSHMFKCFSPLLHSCFLNQLMWSRPSFL